MDVLAGRVAVITGAAGGIGAALARALHAERCRLALVDRDADGLEALRASLGGGASAHVVDLADVAALERLPEQVVDAHGAVHLLVQNAGLTVHGAFTRHGADDVDRVLDVDLRAVIHGARVFLPHLRRADAAHIVNVSSMAAIFGVPMQGTYSAAKAGVRAFGEALRVELAPAGIGVTTVLPGTIATPFLRAATSHDPGASARMSELMLRYGTPPERVASRVVQAVRRNKGEIRVGWDTHLTHLARGLAPALVQGLLGAAYARAVDADGRLVGWR